jgi:arsenate reductase
MAEEYLRKIGGDRFKVESAGLEPGTLNPYVVEILKEDGIDIAGKETRDVFDLFKRGEQYDYVITVCGKDTDARCPIFPGKTVRRNWPFPDPSAFSGSAEEIARQTRAVRDQVVEAINEFVAEYDSRHT